MSNTGLKRLPLETKGKIIPSILTQGADNNGGKKRAATAYYVFEQTHADKRRRRMTHGQIGEG